MPPGWDSQVPPGPYGQPGYPPFGQPAPPGGQQGPASPPPPGYGQGGQQGPAYPPPGYGQGGPAGWNAAPSPGGVPLRPLALGDILNGAVTIARRNPAATFGLAAIVMTIYGVVSAVIDGSYRAQLAAGQTASQNGGSFFTALAVTVLVTGVLSLVLNAALTGM